MVTIRVRDIAEKMHRELFICVSCATLYFIIEPIGWFRVSDGVTILTITFLYFKL